MKERGDDPAIIDSLPIEEWINDVRELIEGKWQGIPSHDLPSGKFISDFNEFALMKGE
jgi:hypothetical protein